MAKKKNEDERLKGAVERISRMEVILDRALEKIDALEKEIGAFEALQPEIRALAEYYEGADWKEDFALDEDGKLPEELKRGVLSEDGIYNMLERNRELLERFKTEE